MRVYSGDSKVDTSKRIRGLIVSYDCCIIGTGVAAGIAVRSFLVQFLSKASRNFSFAFIFAFLYVLAMIGDM